MNDTAKCTWQVQVSINQICPRGCECEGIHGEMWAEARGEWVQDCGADVTETDNGWSCASGHSHITGANYFDEDEIAAMRQGNRPMSFGYAMDGKDIW